MGSCCSRTGASRWTVCRVESSDGDCWVWLRFFRMSTHWMYAITQASAWLNVENWTITIGTTTLSEWMRKSLSNSCSSFCLVRVFSRSPKARRIQKRRELTQGRASGVLEFWTGCSAMYGQLSLGWKFCDVIRLMNVFILLNRLGFQIIPIYLKVWEYFVRQFTLYEIINKWDSDDNKQVVVVVLLYRKWS